MDDYLGPFSGVAEQEQEDVIVGVREVGRERFRTKESNDFVIQGSMIGTHEVMEALDICGDDPCPTSASYFFRK